MINYIWFFLIFIGILFGVLTGNGEVLSRTILDSGGYAIKLIIELTGIFCVWSGIIKIAEESKLNKVIAALLKPFLKILFPNVKDIALENIALNFTANMLGLGNAATPLGIKAMEEMERENRDKDGISNDMVLFLVLNAAAISIVPTTIISIRAALGAPLPSSVILPILIVSVITFISGIIITKILQVFF